MIDSEGLGWIGPSNDCLSLGQVFQSIPSLNRTWEKRIWEECGRMIAKYLVGRVRTAVASKTTA